jgi:hypothetical protein
MSDNAVISGQYINNLNEKIIEISYTLGKITASNNGITESNKDLKKEIFAFTSDIRNDLKDFKDEVKEDINTITHNLETLNTKCFTSQTSNALSLKEVQVKTSLIFGLLFAFVFEGCKFLFGLFGKIFV